MNMNYGAVIKRFYFRFEEGLMRSLPLRALQSSSLRVLNKENNMLKKLVIASIEFQILYSV